MFSPKVSKDQSFSLILNDHESMLDKIHDILKGNDIHHQPFVKYLNDCPPHIGRILLLMSLMFQESSSY